MPGQPFLKPHLVGTRFDGKAIPLEFLKDLAVLEEMIVEVAKSEFLRDHPHRQRSPRGFTDGIELKLTDIEDGSSIPVISLFLTAATLFPPDNQAYFERARDTITRAISAAEQNQSITEHLPEKTLSYFDRLGRSLRDGEAIEFSIPDSPSPARLTKEIRRKLILASGTMNEITDETIVRGTVPEADQDDMTFEIQSIDGRKIRAPIAPQHYDTILDAFKDYREGTRVLIQGIGRFNRNELLLGFESIEHVTILDPLDIPARIDELRLLKDGWLEGGGVAPTHECLDWLAWPFAQYYPDEWQYPYLYPTEDGGVQAEWLLDSYEIGLEIDLITHQGYWYGLNKETDEDEERSLVLDQPGDWEWFTSRIQGWSEVS